LGISGITQQTEFVGGVSDGNVGAAVMDFDYCNTKAKKAWFFFDKEWVALGCGISSSDRHAVATTLNQCLLKTDVKTDKGNVGRGVSNLDNPLWVLHDSIGYVFPVNERITVSAGEQSGSHSDIYAFGSKEKEHKDVFLMTVPHGIQPENTSYAYIVVPSVSEQDMKMYSEKMSVRIIANNSNVQAVSKPEQHVLQVIFHQPGKVEADSMTIGVDQPCLVMINRSAVWVSDPTGKLQSVTLTLEKNGVKESQVVKLPAGDERGKSQRISFALLNGVYATGTFLLEKELSWEILGGGVKRQILGYDKHLMVVKVAFEKGSVGMPHTHIHTQSTFVASGKFEVVIDGKKRILSAGDGFYVAPNQIHGVKCLEAGVLVDSFSPAREDFVKNK
jgi:chondroitin AC lyase